MSNHKELLLTGCFPYSKEQIEKIKQLGFNITFVQNELEEIKFDVSKFEYIVCNGLFLHNPVEKFLNLKFVQSTSAGLERLPIEYFDKHNIKYCNAKNIYSIPIAEWVIMFILNSYKSMNQFFNQKENKEWIKNRDLEELTNKEVTIIGYGNIGKEIAKRLKSFDVIINVVDIRFYLNIEVPPYTVHNELLIVKTDEIIFGIITQIIIPWSSIGISLSKYFN